MYKDKCKYKVIEALMTTRSLLGFTGQVGLRRREEHIPPELLRLALTTTKRKRERTIHLQKARATTREETSMVLAES